MFPSKSLKEAVNVDFFPTKTFLYLYLIVAVHVCSIVGTSGCSGFSGCVGSGSFLGSK